MRLKDKYIKFYIDHTVLYVRKELTKTTDFRQRLSENLTLQTANNISSIMSYADFVVDTTTNSMLKCRYAFDNLLDGALDVDQ